MSDQSQPHAFVGTLFAHQDVRLDGAIFEQCRFSDCRLIYSGDALPQLSQSHAEGEVDFVLAGSALRTVQLLSMFYHRTNQFGREMVEKFVDQLLRGDFEPDARRSAEPQ